MLSNTLSLTFDNGHTVKAIFFCASSAQANLLVYTDRTSFLADAGSTSVYDFESDAASSFRVRDFGDFTIDATGSGIYLAEVRENTGNNDIYINTSSNVASTNLVFDMDVTVFGFDWIAEGNDTWDHSIFSFNGTTYDLGTPWNTGFFGLVENSGTIAAGSVFSFGQQSTNWSGMSFDNITYSSNATNDAPAPVPEPTTILLLGTGLIGFTGLRKRKIKQVNLLFKP